jgi:MFS family permease
MSRRQTATLFICSLIPWTIGNGLFPLLPVYAVRLGANSAAAGLYLTIAYIALTLGALSAGWMSDGLRKRKLPLIIASLINIPLPWLMGRVQTIWALTAITALAWFLGGMILALIAILAGLSSGENDRGRTFGVLALANGLGMLVGGLGVGWLVDHLGYVTMFGCLAIVSVVIPMVALLLEEKDTKRTQGRAMRQENSTGLGGHFYLLFTATILFSIPGFIGALVRSLVMNKLGFSSLDISSTVAIGGLVSLPFPFLMGWISDRIGRKTFLYAAYLVAFVSFVTLALSRELWHFWLVYALGGLALGGYSVGNALVTDLVPPESLGKGLAVIGSAQWIGGIVGFAAAGYMLQNLGLMLTFVIGGCVALAAVGALIPIRTRTPQPVQPEPAST